MQSTLFEPQNLPQLPEPGFVEHWILESPLPLALSCLAIGIIVFGSLRHTKNNTKIGLPVLGFTVILAVALFITSQLITTDREHLKARSAQLVQAASTGDRQALSILLADQVRINASFVTQVGKERIITLAASRAAPMIESASTKEVRAGIDGPLVARTHIKIKVKADMVPPSSWWLIEWTKPNEESTDWVATHIEPLWIQGFTNP